MVNIAFELGNQTKEEIQYSKNIDSIMYLNYSMYILNVKILIQLCTIRSILSI